MGEYRNIDGKYQYHYDSPDSMNFTNEKDKDNYFKLLILHRNVTSEDAHGWEELVDYYVDTEVSNYQYPFAYKVFGTKELSFTAETTVLLEWLYDRGVIEDCDEFIEDFMDELSEYIFVVDDELGEVKKLCADFMEELVSRTIEKLKPR